jgi:O-antigen/teichoic acid export membrane protein
VTNSVESPVAGLGTRLRSGALWGSVNVASSRLLSFVSTIIVARLIEPEHFGALAVAIVVQTLAMNVAELGATAALGRGDRDADEVAPTVFTISLITSGLLTAAIIVTAPALATALGDPDAAGVIRVLSITVMLAGLSAVPSALIWRDFLQGRRIAVDLGNILVTLALVIPLALMGLGAMALAWSRVGGQLFSTIGYWIITPKRYLPGFNRAEAPAILRLGIPLALSNLVVFALLNLDYIVIGRLLDPVALGLYLLAFNLASLPSSVITAIIRTVAVPAFGRIHAAGTLGSAAVRVAGGLSYLAFPVSALIAGLGTPLIVAFYGETWRGAGVAMLGLGVFGVARILTELFADLCVGAGKTVGLFWVQVLWFVALIPIMFAAVSQWGIAGAGFAHAAAATIVAIPAYLVIVRRTTGVSLRRLLLACLPPALAGAACGFLAWWVSGLFANPFLGVAVGGLAGSALYLGATWRLATRLVSDLRLRPTSDLIDK